MRYSPDSIKIVSGPGHVRARPAMYIGDTNERGFHHLAWEVVDNVLDLALANKTTRLDITLHRDGSLEVTDDGPGIPVDPHPKLGTSTLEIIFTVLGCGGKFDSRPWKVSGGLHGVGLSVVNALSSKLAVTVRRDGRTHVQSYERGKPVTELSYVGAAAATGTSIRFTPDPQVFGWQAFVPQLLAQRLRELAYLLPKLTITLEDVAGGDRQGFSAPAGLVDFVRAVAETSHLDTPIHARTRVETSEGPLDLELALTWQESEGEHLLGFANLVQCRQGGSHISGLLGGLTQPFAWLQGLVNTGRPVFDDRHRKGLVAVVSVFLPEPHWEGSTKTRLGNDHVATAVYDLAQRAVVDWATQDPWSAERVVKALI